MSGEVPINFVPDMEKSMLGTGEQVSVKLDAFMVLARSMVKLNCVTCCTSTVAWGFVGFGFEGAPGAYVRSEV